MAVPISSEDIIAVGGKLCTRFCTREWSNRRKSSTPKRIRTSNLRFRRPMLYPVELWVHAAATTASHFGEKWLWRQRGYGVLCDFDR